MGTVTYSVARHISFCVPQPGSTGVERVDVSKSQVTSMLVSPASGIGC